MHPANQSSQRQREFSKRVLAGAARSRWLLSAAVFLTNAAAAPSAWEQLAPLPVPNGGFVSGSLDGKIIVAGGVTWEGDTKIWLDQIWTYDPKVNVWRETGRLPAPLAYPVVGHSGSALWFASGSSGEVTHRTLWKMDPGRSPRVAATLDHGFVYAAGALIGQTLYATGGTDDQGRVDRLTNKFVGIDLRTGAITPLPDYPEVGLTTGTAAAANGKLYVFGGARWDATQKTVVNHASAHAYSPRDQRWERLPDLAYPGRGYAAVALDDRHILVAGGYRSDEVEFVADAYIFDPQSRTFKRTTPLPYAAMVNLVKTGEWIYCLGGEDRKRHRTDAVFRIRSQELLRNAH
jgi:N-acetylneuraminic acid mutarotase